MTDPRENDLYRHPHCGEEVIIDYVTDAEVYLRVTDGAGGLIRACRVPRTSWRAIREVHGLELTNRERTEPSTVVGRVSCPCCDVGFEIQAGDDDESEFVAVIQGSSPVIRDLTESVTQAEERVERAEDTLHKLQRWSLPIDCPDCEGHGSQPPHSPEDGPCETCGGWTDEKRKRWHAIYIAQGESAR